MPVYGTSLLQPVSFPKTFDDVPFVDKMAVLAEGYEPFDPVYDATTGKCISGCPYVGLTLDYDKEQTEMADDLATRDLIQNHGWTWDSETNDLHPADDAPVAQTGNGDFVNKTDCMNNECIKQNQTVPYGHPLAKKVPITSKFGPRQDPTNNKNIEYHKGIDFGTPVGSKVYATANGVVKYAGFDRYGGGNYIEIQHAGAFTTKYLHLSQVLVKTGDKVSGGCVIGKSGASGSRSTGPHLDYRVLRQGTPINPMKFLKCVK